MLISVAMIVVLLFFPGGLASIWKRLRRRLPVQARPDRVAGDRQPNELAAN